MSEIMSGRGVALAALDLRRVGFMSERLVYTALTERQIMPIFQNFTAEVTRWMMPRAPYSLAEARDLVLDTLQAMQRGDHLTLAISSRKNGEFLGCIALNGVGAEVPEIGVWLKLGAQGQGYGREALGSLLAWYQKRFRPEYYVYPADVRNLASCHLAQSLDGRIQRRYEAVSEAGTALRVAEFHIPPVIVR
ncbi:MAG: GNAT family N-acetyltransferase [bacterium]|nr:GNAT family N-acetyltransferase [bacterium]